MTYCTGEHKQFDSLGDCVNFYDRLPKTDPSCLDRENGVSYALQGNTSLCRFLHHFMMKNSPELHCYHSGPGFPDAHGKVKCGPDDCRTDQGPAYSKPVLSCANTTQRDIELRISSALGYCISSLQARMCSTQCARALRQFGLIGGVGASRERVKYRHAKICACRDAISRVPMSFVINSTKVDPVDLLLLCEDHLPGQGSYCGESSFSKPGPLLPDKDVLRTIVTSTILHISESYTLRGNRSVDEVDVNDVDMTSLRVFADDISWPNRSTYSFDVVAEVLAGAELGKGGGATFINGDYILSHANVTAVLSNPNQTRSSTAFFWGRNVSADAWGRHGPTQLSSGTEAHRRSRALLWEAWPVLRNRTHVPSLEQPARSITDAIKTPGGVTEQVKQDIAWYILKSVIDELFPGNAGFTQAEKAALATIAVYNSKSANSVEYHRVSEWLASDSLRIARASFTNWVFKYYGDARMSELAEIRGLTGTATAMALADSAWVNTIKPLGGTVLGILERMSKDACKEIKLFRSSPKAYVIEFARLNSPVEVFAMVPSPGRTSFVSLFQANRDPSVFNESLSFNPSRKDIGRAVIWNAIEDEINAGSGPTLTRACPAHDFSIRMMSAIIEKLLPDKEEMKPICAGIPLKDSDAYKTYTQGQLAVSATNPTFDAMWNSSQRSFERQMQTVIGEIGAEDQSCLFLNDRSVAALRASVFLTNRDNFEQGAERFLEEKVVMRVPGLGTYYGREDALEYAQIMSNPKFNGDYHVFLQQMLTMKFLAIDEINVVGNMVSAWENYSRVSTPIYDNNYGFTSCSSRIREWNLTFAELEDGSNPTFDYFVGGAYSNLKLCQMVQTECYGQHQQFESVAECVNFYDSLEEYDQACLDRSNGVSYSLQGNTTLCRFLHHL